MHPGWWPDRGLKMKAKFALALMAATMLCCPALADDMGAKSRMKIGL